MSNSKLVLDYLRTLDPSKPFTSKQIAEALPDVTVGALTGFLSRLRRLEAIRPVSMDGKIFIHEIVNLDNVDARDGVYPGGKIGRRSLKPADRLNLPQKEESIIDTLFGVIEQLECMKTKLSDFSTKELLEEVERRINLEK